MTGCRPVPPFQTDLDPTLIGPSTRTLPRAVNGNRPRVHRGVFLTKTAHRLNQTTAILSYLAILGVSVAASVTDLRTQRIPNKLTGFAMLGGLAFWLAAGLINGRGLAGIAGDGSGTFIASFIGLLCGLIPFAILVTMGGLGGGDMKLMGAIGAWSASWQVVLATTMYALLAAAMMAILLMIQHKRVKLTLARIAGIAATKGKLIQADDDATAPKVPFAVAALVGVAIAGAEHMLRLWPPLLW